jgi:hypothetical protein
MGGPTGYDGGKKAHGRKRHLVVDTQGLLLKAPVLPADLMTGPPPSRCWQACTSQARLFACSGPTQPIVGWPAGLASSWLIAGDQPRALGRQRQCRSP